MEPSILTGEEALNESAGPGEIWNAEVSA